MRRNAHKGKPQNDGQEQATEQFRGGALKVGEKVRVKDNGMAGEIIRVVQQSSDRRHRQHHQQDASRQGRADLFQ